MSEKSALLVYLCLTTNFGMSTPLQTTAANSLSRAAPDDASALQLSRPGPYGFSANTAFTPPARKKARPSTHHTSSIPLQHTPHKFQIKGPSLPPNAVYGL